MSFVSIPAFCLLCVLAFSPVSWAETYKNLEQYESADGKTFTRKGIFVERADTPSCIEYWSGEILCAFQWFPLNNPKAFGKIALMLSRDDGENWTPPQLTEIAGMPGNLQHVSEPALVALQDGRLRLYFTAQRASAGPRAIFSALSTDGIHYQFEEGERFGFPDKDTSHASIFNYKGTLHLFSPLDKQGRAYHAVSKDGLNFTQLVNAMVQVPGVWIGNGLSLDQEMRFYGSGSEGIWMASSKEGGLWQLDESTQLLGTDPTIVLRKNKTYLAITAVPQGA